MFKSRLIFPSLVIITALVLSSCSPPVPDTSDLDGSDSESFSLDSEAQLNDSSLSNNNLPNMQKEYMKTLADYQPIEATEAVLNTTKGEVVIELFRENAPLTTANFLELIDDGFYNGIIIHRVEPNFVVQFGDPLTKEAGTEAMWGTGGPGYTIEDEFHPALRHDSEGILSMANRGPNTGSSQVFITLEATPWLDDKHAVFGKVSSGMDVVNQLEKGDAITSATYR